MTFDALNLDNQNIILMHNNTLFPAIKSFLTNISKSSLKSPRIHIESKEQFSWWSDKKTTFTFLTCFCCLRVDNKYSFCPFFQVAVPVFKFTVLLSRKCKSIYKRFRITYYIERKLNMRFFNKIQLIVATQYILYQKSYHPTLRLGQLNYL